MNDDNSAFTNHTTHDTVRVADPTFATISTNAELGKPVPVRFSDTSTTGNRDDCGAGTPDCETTRSWYIATGSGRRSFDPFCRRCELENYFGIYSDGGAINASAVVSHA